MKKVVLKLDLHDDRAKQKAMKMVSSAPGVDSIAMDMKEKKLTVVGDIDPVDVVSKLRKVWYTEILTVGPSKEPEKKKDEGKKDDGKNKNEGDKKDEGKKDDGKNKKEDDKKKSLNEQQADELAGLYRAYNPHMTTYYHVYSAEENPNACVIS